MASDPRLSQRRPRAIRNLLIEMGHIEGRIFTAAAGGRRREKPGPRRSHRVRRCVGRIANLEESLGQEVDKLADGMRNGGLGAQLALSSLIQRLEARADALERGEAEPDDVALDFDDEDDLEVLMPLLKTVGFEHGMS